MEEPPVAFRDMTEADLEAGLRLSRASGWNQTLADWRLLLALGPGLFRVGVLDGQVLASGGAVRYGDALAWVCMILVDPDHRGRGLGTRIFDEVLVRCEAELRAGRVRAVGLDATPAGRGIYEQRGFVDGGRLVRLRVEPSAPAAEPPGGVWKLEPGDLDAVLARDRQVFGADRASLLRWAQGAAPDLARVVREGDRVRAYCVGRHGDHSDHVGPVVAEDRESALALVRAALSLPRARPLILDARDDASWLETFRALGFRDQRPFTRMYLGAARPAARPAFEPVVLGPEFG